MQKISNKLTIGWFKHFKMNKLKILESCIVILLIMVGVGTLIIIGYSKNLEVSVHHIDGAYQTASALFRINDNQKFSTDFYPYLGLGPIILIYPLFKLLGTDLHSSMLAANITTMILSWLAISTIWKLVFKRYKFYYALLCGLLIFLLFKSELQFLYSSGNSLKPIRSFLPYFTCFSIYLIICHIKIQKLQIFLFGITVGLCIIWSNDYAIPTMLISFLFILIYLLRTKKSNTHFFYNTFILCVVIVLTVFIFYYSLTNAQPIQLILYNYVDVAQDQWWYFGSYNSKNRFFSFLDILKIIEIIHFKYILILGMIGVIAYKKRSLEYFTLLIIGLILLAGGSLASIGGHIERDYFSAFIIWTKITVFCLIIKLLLPMFGKNINNKLLLIASSAVIFFIFTNNIYEYKNHRVAYESNAEYIFSSSLGGYIHKSWKDYTNFALLHSDKLVLEDYWGIWGAINKKNYHWKVDSIIHALGKTRSDSKEKMRDAEYIITTKFTTDKNWQPWIVSQNFWFYEELLNGWKPIFESPNSIVWHRTKKNDVALPKVECRITYNGEAFSLATDEFGYYRVNIQYETPKSDRLLFMIRNNISFIAGPPGYVSLPTNRTQYSFPILVTKAYETFDTKMIGSEKSPKLLACHAENINFMKPYLFN